jgi:DNA modification methylase
MLYQQDCLKYSLEVPDCSFNLIIADPPYKEIIESANWDYQWTDDENYLNWLEMRIQEFARLLTTDGNLILYCKRQLSHHIRIRTDKYLTEQRTIIWVRRRNAGTTRGKTLASGYEPILWYSKSDHYIFNAEMAKTLPQPHLKSRKEYQKGGRLEKGVGLTDAWIDIPALPHNSPEKVSHPTQKPLKLSERIVNIFSSETSRVYVPFAGSGSEIIACCNLNREWEATETNPEYIALIQLRLKMLNKKIDKWF